MTRHFRLAIGQAGVSAGVLSILRRHTGKPLSDLRDAIAHQKPFLDESPHHNQYDTFIGRVTALLADLEGVGIQCLVEVDGVSESLEYLRNLFQLRQDIKVETSRMSDLESGEPSIETLLWLKNESPPDVFRQTIRQIIDGDGYTCDDETIAWARRIQAAEPSKDLSSRSRTSNPLFKKPGAPASEPQR